MMEALVAIFGVGLWIITAFGTVYVDTLTDREKVLAGVCLKQDARLIKIGKMYYCDPGPDPTPEEGYAK